MSRLFVALVIGVSLIVPPGLSRQPVACHPNGVPTFACDFSLRCVFCLLSSLFCPFRLSGRFLLVMLFMVVRFLIVD